MFRPLFLAALGAALACAADPHYESARQKIQLIQEDRAKPGSRVWLSAAELDAYGRRMVLDAVPQGVSALRLELGNGSATGSGLVDLLKVRQAKGPAPNPLAAWMLAGEHRVRVDARIDSGSGRATVHLMRVTVGWVTAQGAVLDFLIENFFLPNYPDAIIGTPFDLHHNVDRFEISPAGVNVVIAPKR